jgi:hypothetical protein
MPNRKVSASWNRLFPDMKNYFDFLLEVYIHAYRANGQSLTENLKELRASMLYQLAQESESGSVLQFRESGFGTKM